MISSMHQADPAADAAAFAGPTRSVQLSPAQQHAYQRLEEALGVSPILALMGVAGIGKSTVARALASSHAGRVIDMSDVYQACLGVAAAKWEEAVERMMMEAFDTSPLVILDDFAQLNGMSMPAGVRGQFFPRVVLRHLMATVVQRDLRMILVGPPPQAWQSASDYFGEQTAMVAMSDFTSKDYAAIAAGMLGEARVAGIDFRTVYRYASMLNGYQLRLACGLLREHDGLDADAVIECLQTSVLFSNTRIEQVEALSFDTLPGSEAIVEELETHLILPFENRELAQKMGLKPKRGVLLYGPPGTGKTSIGRALAHRIKGKFFLIDGSFVSEPPGAFFQRIQNTVREAKENSPSILFIDDADVLFNIEHIAGLVRYLLSLLDGLESETASNVCVMMTAMDASKIPDALLRSGRVELWLETKVPDLAVRERILRRWMGTELPAHEALLYPLLAEATEGFTAADLRRIAGDAKALYAADLVAGRPTSVAMLYVVAAINEIVGVRADMAKMLGDPSLRAGHLIEIAPVGHALASSVTAAPSLVAG